MSTTIDAPPSQLMSDNCSRSRARLLLATSLFLLLAAVAALLVDVPLGQWCLKTFSPAKDKPWWLDFLAQLLRFSELFGHGLGVTLAVCLIFFLDPTRRWVIPRLVTLSLASGLTIDLLKILVSRRRPYSFRFDGPVWQTFEQWLPLGKSTAAIQSLPSGHTGLAIGLALALIWIYPRGRCLFPVLAVLVACQRVQVGAHWLSDVLSGAAVGCLVATVILYAGPIPRMFSRWEAVWKVRDQEREQRRAEQANKRAGEQKILTEA